MPKSLMSQSRFRHCEDPGLDPGDAAIQGNILRPWIASPGVRPGRNDGGAVRLTRRTLLGASAALLAAPLAARAQTQAPAPGSAVIDVNRARAAPIPIAFSDFGSDLGRQITGVVNNDLTNCGLFRAVGGGPEAAASSET
ncbi:MAG: hypothetical protein JO047_09735, partial [Alphaproteobacteria bacterium]|nr:hypothetical protein [Alphaproteobacteria bacterium]